MRRCNTYPALPGLKTHIKGQTESKLVNVETQALILIANENIDGMNAEVRSLAVHGRGGLVHRTEGRRTGHGGYYKSAKSSCQLTGKECNQAFGMIESCWCNRDLSIIKFLAASGMSSKRASGHWM